MTVRKGLWQAFGEDVGNDDFPIACVKIEPLNEKFADELTHRDFF